MDYPIPVTADLPDKTAGPGKSPRPFDFIVLGSLSTQLHRPSFLSLSGFNPFTRSI
jgi:hypothetical protein